MMLNNKTIIPLIITIAIIIFFIIDHFHKEKIEHLTHNKYLNNSQTIKKYVDQSIKQKKQQGLSIALSLSQNQYYIDFFKDNSLHVDLKALAKNLKQYTNQQNVWIHFVSKDGISLYRSWAKKKGDNVAKIRKELPPLLANPKPTNLISVGIFDLSFKSIVPVYENNNFLGIIEVISKVNSISDNLQDVGYAPVVLVDKKYKKQLKKPFTKTFIGDYYVANINASKTNIDAIGESLEELIAIKDYKILDNQIITTYYLNDVFDNDMAYFVIFEDINNVSLQDIINLDNFIKTLGIFIVLLVFVSLVSLYFYNRSRYTKTLENKVEERTKSILQLKDYHSALFDQNPNIVFVAVIDHGIIEANSSFFNFFPEYSSLQEFNNQNKCLCNFAIEMDDETYINPNDDWKNQITQEHKKLAIKKDNKIYHYRLDSKVLDHSEYTSNTKEAFLITLTDITKLIETQKDLQEKQKLADMGEMIGNIAHQWRQPLSVISTSATGILMYKEYGGLNDEILDREMNNINNNAQYLSKTIDDFRDFIKGDRTLSKFNLKDNVNTFLNLVEGSIKAHNISVVLDVDENIICEGYPNELTQCFINIFNNAKDALKDNKDEKYFFISIQKDRDTITMKFKDNGGGIPKNIISKVFEPYFTTKHQSKGTGLGLSMTYKLITEGMGGDITVNNTSYTYNNETYTGAEFLITVNINQPQYQK